MKKTCFPLVRGTGSCHKGTAKKPKEAKESLKKLRRGGGIPTKIPGEARTGGGPPKGDGPGEAGNDAQSKHNEKPQPMQGTGGKAVWDTWLEGKQTRAKKKSKSCPEKKQNGREFLIAENQKGQAR